MMKKCDYFLDGNVMSLKKEFLSFKGDISEPSMCL